MKKKLIIITGVFLLFLIPGLLLHTQQGLRFGNDFWCKKGDMFVCRTNSITHSDDTFELTLSGRKITVSVSTTADGAYLFEFQDGTALEFTPYDFSDYLLFSDGKLLLSSGTSPQFRPTDIFSVGHQQFASDGTLILTDISHPALIYATPGESSVEYYTDETGKRIGERFTLMSKDNRYITGYTQYYDSERPERPKPILLYDGIRLDYATSQESLYVNPDGDYLMNSEELFSIRSSIIKKLDKHALASFLMDIADGRTETRGNAWAVLLYAFFYLFGTAMLFLPEQMAAFLRREQYYARCGWSYDGLKHQRVLGGFALGFSIVILLIPFFL